MLEIIKAGGWMMWPIIACSIVALAIIGERFWTLRPSRIMPPELAAHVWNLHRKGQLDSANIRQLRLGSPLGAILAAGLANHRHGREIMKESLEQAGRAVVHELGRYLTTLGTIAAISPYLGLLGSVLGMIKVFSTFSAEQGIGNPAHLAGGISEILVATASGLAIAIPSLMFHRYFNARIEDFTVRMEEEAVRLVEILHGERED
ncbi:MotA/TolQ/ExbB proton channel family protein [Methylococcus sp. EFPC2]|uniref:MotA/TolQ/ExbB proton channel family protein n=1 Tax=Methylococcus sp. EFPC2 TaxID=2812648 RepID=UPI0019678669|nr:MotA/TolQ/ExbB proton channel family protein [Methylococcus sp. EFPC2]QSA97344.1 MotA/TolQ/ExbB proton channel family protein [Methylococcus sp. EFPC2]